jgi:hypothetical protein
MKACLHKFLPFIAVLAACGFSAGDVKLLDTYTKANKLTTYQYLAIPKAAPLTDLISITQKMAASKGKETRQEVLYNYYVGAERTRKFAVFNSYKTRHGQDTLVVIHYAKGADMPHAKAAATFKQFMEKDQAAAARVLPDSCLGVWKNWLNPFGFYLIVYKQRGVYRIQDWSPGLGGNTEKALPEADLAGKLLQVSRLENSGWHTYRYRLNNYKDIHLTDEEPDGRGEYMLGIYNYICDCPHKQQWPK